MQKFNRKYICPALVSKGLNHLNPLTAYFMDFINEDLSIWLCL